MTAPRPIRTFIADDEPIALRGIRRLLAADSELEIVGEARDSTAAAAAMARIDVELLFLDIEMPDANGLECLRQLARPLPVVVFVTAFEQYALRAFGARALDYVLKPFSDERLREAVARAKEQIAHRRRGAIDQRLEEMLARVSTGESNETSTAAAAPRFAARLVTRQRDRVVLLAVNDVHWIEAVGYRAKVHSTHGVTHLRTPLDQLERILDPRCFVRVHRSAIVRIDCIREIQAYHRASFVVVLANGTRIPLSRRRRAAIDLALRQAP